MLPESTDRSRVATSVSSAIAALSKRAPSTCAAMPAPCAQMGGSFLVRRLGGALITIAAIAVLNFFLFRMLPGDPINSLLPRNVSQAQKEALRARLGLNQPVFPGVIRNTQGQLQIDLTTLPAM